MHDNKGKTGNITRLRSKKKMKTVILQDGTNAILTKVIIWKQNSQIAKILSLQ